jgi:uncharacterized protein YrrD
MQHNLRSLTGYAIRATDGDLGKVHDFYFDDITWSIRYLVAETKNWLSSRKVLISLVVLDKPDLESKTLKVDLSCLQVRNSPEIDTQLPLYRRHEAALHEYYHWAPYWETGYGGTLGITPYPLYENMSSPQGLPEPERRNDLHLRSTRHVTGYRIQAADGEIGIVEDFIIDDDFWSLKHLVVATGNWLSGRKVLISPAWITNIHWEEKKIYIDHSRESVDNSPEFDPFQLFIPLVVPGQLSVRSKTYNTSQKDYL